MGSPYTPQPYAPQGGYPGSYSPSTPPQGNPPRMNWVVVLVLAIVTLGIYTLVQLIVQASWVKRATANAKALNLALAATGVYVLLFVLSILLMFSSSHAIVTLVQLGYVVVYVMAAFATRDGVNAQLGIETNGVLTFLFSSIYLQYKINQVLEGGAAFAPAPVYPGQVPQNQWGGQPQQPYGQPPQPYGGQPQQPYGQPSATPDFNQTVPYGRPAYGQQAAQPQPPQYGQPEYGQPQQGQPGQAQWPQANPNNNPGNGWPQR